MSLTERLTQALAKHSCNPHPTVPDRLTQDVAISIEEARDLVPRVERLIRDGRTSMSRFDALGWGESGQGCHAYRAALKASGLQELSMLHNVLANMLTWSDDRGVVFAATIERYGVKSPEFSDLYADWQRAEGFDRERATQLPELQSVPELQSA